MWPWVFRRLLACLLICALFTGCVFVVKEAYVQVGGGPFQPICALFLRNNAVKFFVGLAGCDVCRTTDTST